MLKRIKKLLESIIDGDTKYFYVKNSKGQIKLKRKKMKTNLNQLAKKITLKEGLKESVSIAQVKEVMRLFLLELKTMTLEEVVELLKRK